LYVSIELISIEGVQPTGLADLESFKLSEELFKDDVPTVDSIRRGLDYLVNSQRPEGGWTRNGRPHVLVSCRSLVSLPFRRMKKDSMALERGLEWLIGLQNRDGSWDGDLDATQAAVVLLLRRGFGKDDWIIRGASTWIWENRKSYPWSYFAADSKRREWVLARCREVLSRRPDGQDRGSALIAYIADGLRWPKLHLDEVIGGSEVRSIFANWIRRNETGTSLLHKKYGDGWMFVDESNSPLLRAALVIDSICKMSPPDRPTVVGEVAAYITRSQNEDGGWGYEDGVESQANPTAMILSALIRAEMSWNL